MLILASNNEGKARELAAILGPALGEVKTLRQVGVCLAVEEDADTFEGNALKKAMEAMRVTGQPALADDSGLEVDALGGAPGVYSARYAGEHGDDGANNRKLVAELAPKQGPYTARFACAVALTRPGREPVVVKAVCEGQIVLEARGENGFGYDPHFVPRGYAQTFAELPAAIKNQISHRGRALEALRQALETENA